MKKITLRLISGLLAFSLVMIFTGDGLAQDEIGTMDEVFAGAEPGKMEITSSSQGEKTYEAKADCEALVQSLLQTYGHAKLSVELNGETVIFWERQNDKDSSELIVDGKPVNGSNPDVGGGDYTPEPQETKIKLKKGDKVVLKLNGDFGSADSYLRLIAPGIVSDDDDSEDGSGKVVEGSGGGFLWKPVSESRGGVCVILLPSKYRHEQFNRKLWINGEEIEPKDWRDGYANGNRMHIFLKKKGSEYGAPVTIELGLKSGGKVRWNVPNGARRTEM
ncbi:MAG: hypothetical protein ACQETH_00925 [Candidatus Rifleibacteriota bacterium]